ncbi:MAG TPA: hypothetical protein VJH23_00210 [archaeon]|nr:hypothetical protein [archaeon]
MKKIALIVLIAFTLLFGCTQKAPQQENTANAMKDCATNFDCFIDSADKGNSASVTNSVTVDFFGMKQTSTSYAEIRSCSDGVCSYYTKFIDASATFPEGTPQEAIDSSNKVYAAIKGLDGTCTFKQSDLVSMLKRWKDGNFSTADYDEGDCKGDLFKAQVIDTGNNGNGATIDTENGDNAVAESSGSSSIGSCTDSDGGKSYFMQGTTTGIWDFYTGDLSDPALSSAHTDLCLYNYGEVNGNPAAVDEYYCNSSGRKSEETYLCPKGCVDGACIK